MDQGTAILGWVLFVWMVAVVIVISILFDLAEGFLLEYCQAELPRNQHCELIAVPKEVK